MRGPPMGPGLPGARANQTDPVRFVSEAAEPVFRRGPPGARGRPRTHAAGNPRGTDLCPRARGPHRRNGGFHLANRDRPWSTRLRYGLDSRQVVAIQPESEEARPVRPRPEDRTARAVVVWTPEGAYLSKVPPGPSKA